MANEAVKRYSESSAGDVIQDYTCADGTGIEKGAVLELSDPRTVATATTALGFIAGIAAREKIASDGRTKISVYKRGYFDMVASGAIVVGNGVMFADSNKVKTASGVNFGASGAAVIGYAEETASDGETILVRLNL